MRCSPFRPLAVLALSGGLIIGTALPALAHHPELSGVVACTSGQQIITWTVKNSETTTGSNRTMTIDQLSVSSGSVVGLAVGAVFPPQPKVGSVKTATTTLSGTKTGTVTLTVRADWYGGSQDVVRSTSVTLAGGCTVPTTTTTVPPTTTTTTTVPPTTTTTLPPTTTTTQPPTTTTTQPPSTTTTQPPTTTTTQPPTTTTTGPTTTTTQPPTTTTTVPSTTTSTVLTTITTEQTEVLGETLTKAETPEVLAEKATAPGGPLAHTGAAIGLLAFLGGGLLWIGVPLRRFKRRPADEQGDEG